MFNKKIKFEIIKDKELSMTVLSCLIIFLFVGLGIGFLIGEIVGKNVAEKSFGDSLINNALFCENQNNLLNFFVTNNSQGKIVAKARCLAVDVELKNLTDEEKLKNILDGVDLK